MGRSRLLWMFRTCAAALAVLALPGAAAAQLVVGPARGSSGDIQFLEPTGTRTVDPFPGFTGGVSLTLGDVDGDGTADIIAGAGPGGGPHVRVFSGTDLSELASFFAFDPAFTGGVHVGAGDLNGDGRADIIVGAGPGGGPHVKVFSGSDFGLLASFMAYHEGFLGGVYVAGGDVDGDGRADIVTGAGPGGGPHVKVFSGTTLFEIRSFNAYDNAFRGGVRVAAGDIDGDGVSDLVTGPGPSGGPHVRVFSGLTLAELASFYAYDPGFTGGIGVATGDYDGDERVDLIFGADPPGGPHVRILSGVDLHELASFLADVGDSPAGGVSIGAQGDRAGLRFTSPSTTTFPAGAAGTFTVTTAGHPVPAITSSGALPSGVTVVDNGDGTATIAGTPGSGAGGAYPLTLTASNGVGTPVTQSFTLTVSEPPAITSAAATTFPVGAPGTFTVTTTGFPAPAITRGGAALPAEITWVDNGNGTGTLSGTPAPGTSGTYAISFTATNLAGTSAPQAFTLTINDAPGFTSANNTAFTVGSAGSFTVTTVGTPTASLTRTGALPSGVTFLDNGNGTGTLSGTPAAGTGGAYPLTFTATNSSGTTTQSFTLTVNQAPAVTSAASTTFAIGAAGSFTVTTSGFPAPTLARGGAALPSGLTFVDNGDGTGTLSGTPAAGTGGTYAISFTATNAAGTSAPQAFTLTVSLAPTITSANATTFTVGSAGTFTISATGFPLPGITHTGALPAGVGLVDNGNGTATLSGTPGAGTTGVYPITVTAANGVLPNATQTFTLTVNQAPAITSANSVTFTIGLAGSFTVTTSGVPAPTVTIGGVPLPANLLFADNGNGTGTLSGTPAVATEGTYALTFTAANGVTPADTQTFTLTVISLLPPTLDPIADRAPILENAGLQTVNLTGITAGGSETQPLEVTASSDTPAVIPNPTVTYTSPAATGSLSYTPVANAFGTAIITVTVTDGGLDNTLATAGDNGTFTRQFTVTVTGVNEPPTLDAIADPAPIAEDAGLQTVNLTGITAGPGESSQPLQVTASSNNTGLIPNPTVTYTSPAATGSLSYTPVANVSGSAIITVTVTDGGLDNNLGTAGDNGTVSRTFTVVVSADNDSPTLDAIPDPAAILEEAGLQTVNLTGITAGGGETQVLTVTALSNNTALIPNPTVTYTSPNATGSLAYTPVANAFGTAIVTVRVTDDGTAFVERTFTVTVTPVNDVPSFTAGGNQTVLEDVGPQTVAAWATSISPGPGESDTLTFVVTNNTNPGLFATAPDVAANGTLTYTPAAGASGIASLTLVLTDNGGTANGGVNQSAAQVFTITVTAVNDPPTLDAIADPAVILEDAGLQTVNLTGITAGAGESSQPLQVTAVSNNTAVIPNPTVTYTSPGTTGSLSYTPVANASGSAVITVTVTDGGLDETLGTPGDNGTVVRTFTVVVTGVNDAPSFTAGGNQTVAEDAGPQTVVAWATAISPGPGESDAVTFVITNNTNPGLFATAPAVAANGTLTYTSAANLHGVATITLQITDNGGTANGGVNQSATQQFTITVTPVNDVPVAAAKAFTAQANLLIGYTINLAANGSGDVTDVDNNDAGFTTQDFTLTSVAALACAGCVATITDGNLGTFTFEPPPGQTGTFTLTYRVTDNGNPPPGVQSVPGAVTGQPGVITITVSGPTVWFVDSTAPGGGNGTWTGTNAKAFQTIAQADAVNLAGDRIFVINNNIASINYAGNLGLLAGERLIGQGVPGVSFDAVVLGVVPPAGTAARPGINGTRPTLQGTTTLADGVTVTGVNFAPAGAIPAMFASGLVATVPITIDMVNVTGGTSALNLQNVSFAASGGISVSNAAFTNTTLAEVLINQGNIPVTLNGTVTISSNAGRSIDIQNHGAGSVIFNGPITDTGQGIFLNANTGSPITFNGGLSLSTGANPGFTATGGGTLTVTQNNTTVVNTITTTTGTALNVANTTIGPGGLTFRSITAGTGAGSAGNGIVLDSTGTAAGNGILTVTGNSGAGTGGTIQHKTGADGSTTGGIGIYLNNTKNHSFSLMQLNDFDNFAIRGTDVQGFTMANVVINGTNGTNDGFDEGPVSFANLTGSASVTNSSISGSVEHNMQVLNSSGTLNRLTVSGTTFGAMSAATGSDALLIESSGTAVMNVTANANTFTSARGDHFQYSNTTAAQAGDVVFTNNTITNAHPAVVGGGGGIRVVGGNNTGQNGNITFNVSGNSIQGARGTALAVNKLGGTGTYSGTIANNLVGATGVQGSGSLEGSGIFVLSDGGGTYTASITGNTVRQFDNDGIFMQTGGSGVIGTGAMNVTVTGNTVTEPETQVMGALATNGFHLNGGTTVGDTYQICVNLSGNTLAGSGQDTIPAGSTFGDFRLRQRQSTTVRLPGYAGAATDTAAVVAFIQGQNPGGESGVAAFSSGGFTGGAACPTP